MMIKNLDKTNILHKTTQESDDKQSDDLLKSTIKIQKYFRTYTKNLKEAIINEIYDNTNNPNIITEIHEINSYKIEKNNTNKDKSNSKYFASYTITPNYTKDRHKNLTINNIKINKIFYHPNDYLFTITNGNNKIIIKNDTNIISFIDKKNYEFNSIDFKKYLTRKELFNDLTSLQDYFPVFIKNKFFYITINRGDNTFDYVNYNGCISFLLLDYNNKNDKLDHQLLQQLLNSKQYDEKQINGNSFNPLNTYAKERIFQNKSQAIVEIIDNDNNHVYFWFIKINDERMFAYKAPEITIMNQPYRFQKILKKLQNKEITYINQDTLLEFFQIKNPIIIKKFLNLKDWYQIIKDVDKLASKGYALTDIKLENTVVRNLNSGKIEISMIDVGDVVCLGKVDLEEFTYTRNYINSNISNYITNTSQYSKYIAYYNLILSIWQSLEDFNIYKAAAYILKYNCISIKQKASLRKKYNIIILEKIEHVFQYNSQQKNIDLIFIKENHVDVGIIHTTYSMYYYNQTPDIKITKYNIPLFQKININKQLDKIQLLNQIITINDNLANYLYENKFYNNHVRLDNDMRDAIILWMNKYIKPQYYEAFKILLSKPYELEKSNINLFDIFYDS